MPMTPAISTELIQPHQRQFMRQFVANKIQQDYKTPQALEDHLKIYANRIEFIENAFKDWRQALILNIEEFNKTAPDLEVGEMVQFARSAPIYGRCETYIKSAIEDALEGTLEAAIDIPLPRTESIPPPSAAPINPFPVVTPAPATKQKQPVLASIPEENDADLLEALRLSNQPQPEDPALAAAMAASLASANKPSPLAPRSEKDQLAAVLAASQASAEADERDRQQRILAKKEQADRDLAEALKKSQQEIKPVPQQMQVHPAPVQNVQNVPPSQLQNNLFSREDLIDLERIKTEAKQYIASYNSKPAHQGTFYGRSDQISKLALVTSLVTKLNAISASTNSQQLILNLGDIYANINENKTYTGHTIFHPHSVLTKILEDTEKLFTKNLNSLAQLEAYRRGLELTHAEKKTGFLGLKSNQKAKLEISKNIFTLLNDASINTETKITELKKAIKENRKATGPNWLHGPGKLEPILENLLNNISPPQKTRKPGTRNKKSS